MNKVTCLIGGNMIQNRVNDELRQYLIRFGLDFGNYGTIFIKTGLIFMLEQSDIIFSNDIFKRLSIEYNKEIETIKKGIRVSINDALKRGLFNFDGRVLEKLSTKKAFIILYQEFVKNCNCFMIR